MTSTKDRVRELIGPHDRFAVPERALRPYVKIIGCMGLEPERRWVKIGSYELDAYVMTRPEDPQDSMQFDDMVLGLDPLLFSVSEICRAGRRKVPYFCGTQSEVSFVPVAPDDEQAGGRHPYPTLLKVVERMSRLSGGLRVNFHEEKRGAGPHPKPDEDGVINIYPWMHPPGESEDTYASRLFGDFISKDGQGILTYMGVPGRGIFVRDGKRNVVQCIGNNWYVLFATAEFYNLHTTERILERALAATLGTYQCVSLKAMFRPQGSVLGRAAFVKTVTDWANWQAASIDNVLHEQEEKIRMLRKELAQLERQQFDLYGVRNGLEERGTLRELIGSFPEQWRRIRSNERVESVMLVKDGIHVRTHPIVIEHGGHPYPMGRFVIRISKDGVLTVWNEDRLHPNGVPHPHIDGEGTPCMGNATSAVDRAAAEHRYADAVEYTIRWLAEGYEEKLALHPITEWPYEERREDGTTVSCVRLDAYDIGEAADSEEGRPS